MAHREEILSASPEVNEFTVWLSDVEPFMGLCAATARFCGALTENVYKELSPDATEALSVIQGILWRLEHANVERKS